MNERNVIVLDYAISVELSGKENDIIPTRTVVIPPSVETVARSSRITFPIAHFAVEIALIGGTALRTERSGAMDVDAASL